MAEKTQPEEEPAWKYTHPTDHPDNKPPVTTVAVPSDEAKEQYEAAMNVALEKTQPKEEAVTPEAAAAKVNYEEKTVHELKELAKERGLEIPWDARKDEIITALEKQDKSKG